MADSSHCMYFVTRKKRFCHMTVRKDTRYCGEHQQENSDTDADNLDKRIVCPLDPKHTCYKSKLTKHLRVCNAKRKLEGQPAFVVKGVNLGDEMPTATPYVPLSKLDATVVTAVIRKIHSAYEKLPSFSTTVLQHDTFKAILNNKTYGNNTRKHLVQSASLLGHLEQAGLVQDDTCFIEFGAGKAQITYWLGQIIKTRSNTCTLVVDRSSHRHKNDNKLKREGNCPMIKRVRVDIADLQLNQVEEIQSIKYKVGIAKHLCGTATDLAIRCLVNSMNDEPRVDVRGLIIAFCCHHKCEYSSYVGKEYLRECGFTADEFPILCKLVSWAICGSRSQTNAQSRHNVSSEQEEMPADDGENASHLSEIFNDRKSIGRKAKTLLNWGRLVFLQSFGLRAELLHYVSTDITLENMCIVAVRQHSV